MLRLEFETARQLRATSGVLGLALLGGAASFIAMLLMRSMVVGALPGTVTAPTPGTRHLI